MKTCNYFCIKQLRHYCFSHFLCLFSILVLHVTWGEKRENKKHLTILSFNSSDEGHLLCDLLWPSVTVSSQRAGRPGGGRGFNSSPPAWLAVCGVRFGGGAVGGQISQRFPSVAADQLLHPGGRMDHRWRTNMKPRGDFNQRLCPDSCR